MFHKTQHKSVMKQQISSNTKWKCNFFSTLALCGIFFLIKGISTHKHTDFQHISLLTACIIVCIGVYYLIKKRKQIKYDTDYLYIENDINEKKIPFQDIHHLQLLIYRFNNSPTWTIEYQVEDKKEKVWLVSSYRERPYLDAFITKIKREYPHVKITTDNETLL